MTWTPLFLPWLEITWLDNANILSLSILSEHVWGPGFHPQYIKNHFKSPIKKDIGEQSFREMSLFSPMGQGMPLVPAREKRQDQESRVILSYTAGSDQPGLQEKEGKREGEREKQRSALRR